MRFAKISVFTLTLALLTATPLAADDGKSAGDHFDDGWIHTKVKASLSTNSGGSINIEVYKGEVQLAGFTSTPELAKSLPERAARVKGVKKVYNQIIVVEPGRSAGEVLDDGLLVTSVESAMADDAVTRALEINTESNRGRVLLSGFIDSDDQRLAVIANVQNVDGVEEIIDGMNLKNHDTDG